MADFDNIWLVTDLTPVEALKVCMGYLDLHTPIVAVETHHGMGAKTIASDLLWIWSMPAYVRHYPELDMSPNVNIDFNTNDIGEFRETMGSQMIGVVLNMIRHYPSWEVALLTNDASVMLVCKARKLVLQQRPSFWTPERLAMVDIPYTTGTFEEL